MIHRRSPSRGLRWWELQSRVLLVALSVKTQAESDCLLRGIFGELHEPAGVEVAGQYVEQETRNTWIVQNEHSNLPPYPSINQLQYQQWLFLFAAASMPTVVLAGYYSTCILHLHGRDPTQPFAIIGINLSERLPLNHPLRPLRPRHPTPTSTMKRRRHRYPRHWTLSPLTRPSTYPPPPPPLLRLPCLFPQPCCFYL